MRRRGDKSGQSLVEFALILPLLVLLLYGLAEFGFLLYGHVQVTNAAREGARAGSLYLGSRFHYTAVHGLNDCWSMQSWVENALVQHNRDGKGCPESTYSTATHAFGLLSSAPCTSAEQMHCWTLQPLLINGAAFTDTPAEISRLIGDPLQVEVIYRYDLPLLGGVFQANPVLIQKRVIMRVQNN